LTANLETRNSKAAVPLPIASGQVRDFTDLITWKLARELRRNIYSFARKLPAREQYGLASQISRAAISVTANIAEGFGRYSYRENIQFCRQARGSASEVRDHLTTALDGGFLSENEWKAADDLAQRVIQVLNGHIRSTQSLEMRRKVKK
jgi:four helix bundle protein